MNGRGRGMGAGGGKGRGQGGKGRGRMGGSQAAGSAGDCICPQCGQTEPHQRGGRASNANARSAEPS